MIPIQIICMGRLKGTFDYVQPGIDDYLKRLKPFTKVDIIELPDETITPSVTAEQILAREAAKIMPYIEKAAYTIALSERGHGYTSLQLAEEFARRGLDRGNPPNGGTRSGGSAPMILLVGGALGLSQTVLDASDWVVSLSKLTFPHPMVRLILLEQLYRVFKILNNQPYHK